jgi:hypothetical protein
MTDKKDNSDNNSPDKAVIENDNPPQALYVSQKCNRLASAIYAVTRFLADEEPLKTKLRNLALSLSETARRPGKTSEYANLFDLLAQLQDKLTIARDGGLLSSMNHRILSQEITNLHDRLRENDLSFGPQINGDYFELEKQLQSASSGRNKSPAGSSKKVTADNTDKESDSSTTPTSAKERRRQKILDLFEDTDEITVNDVTEIINGYSTKTIQRDLKALVKSGKLQKHGKRRWTSYTKA